MEHCPAQKLEKITKAVNDVQLSQKKNKRKKDKSAGLLMTFNKEKQQVEKVSKPKTTQPSNTHSFVKIKKQKESNFNLSDFRLNNKANKSKLAVQMKKNSAASKVQKKTNLIQLANALKSKSSQSSSSSTDDKLKQMMR